MERIPKAKFKIGDEVLINPMGELGKWTNVDRQLKIEDKAKIASKKYFMPDTESIESGSPKVGYWEYILKWKTKDNRPLYGLAEMFLVLANSKEATLIRKYYRLQKEEAFLRAVTLPTLEKEYDVAWSNLRKLNYKNTKELL